MSIRILVADDSVFWRKEIMEVLMRSLDGLVFEAGNGYEAVYRARWIHPDVAILDYSIPVLDGLGASRQ